MPNDPHEGLGEPTVLVLPWGMNQTADGSDGSPLGLWLSGGVALALWTALALVLTAA